MSPGSYKGTFSSSQMVEGSCENGDVLHTALAAATTLVAIAVALATRGRWLDRRAPQQLAWTLALGAFAAASSAQWAGAALGWDAVSFRVFYLFGPIVSVP